MKKLIVIPIMFLLVFCVACSVPVNSATDPKYTESTNDISAEILEKDNENKASNSVNKTEALEDTTEETNKNATFNHIIENSKNKDCSVSISIPAVSSYKVEKSTDGEYCIYEDKNYVGKCYIVEKEKLGFEGYEYNHATLVKSDKKWNMHVSETDGKVSMYTGYKCESAEMVFVFNGKEKEDMVKFISSIEIKCENCK